MGVPVTFITGTCFSSSMASIPGVDFVPLKGIADFDLSRLLDYFPDRAKLSKEAFMVRRAKTGSISHEIR